ncbi:MAG: hypothetical protein M9898_14580 [Chitinophagaceae bacterium]|nr:hypothetical protein [Chitinophagaceae bacterium]
MEVILCLKYFNYLLLSLALANVIEVAGYGFSHITLSEVRLKSQEGSLSFQLAEANGKK